MIVPPVLSLLLLCSWSANDTATVLPLLHNTTVIEQPVDLNTLSQRYVRTGPCVVRVEAYLCVRVRVRALSWRGGAATPLFLPRPL